MDEQDTEGRSKYRDEQDIEVKSKYRNEHCSRMQRIRAKMCPWSTTLAGNVADSRVKVPVENYIVRECSEFEREVPVEHYIGGNVADSRVKVLVEHYIVRECSEFVRRCARGALHW
ncbi:hypothetical protein DL346_23490 [Paenibacillus montanisoli]|uniref:Uncharacterized protein n=1 Tax=Paenibacillus montanisoli TaxID=2081970 RepID=A0A328TY40_9BACL|nr:hypothetical protein DL346_23490 [Paenibacillus montanisoli]